MVQHVGQSPVPGWFAQHRLAVLAWFNGTALAGLALFMVPFAIRSNGKAVWVALLAFVLTGIILMIYGVKKKDCWALRKGAGIAVLSWIAAAAMAIASIHLTIRGCEPPSTGCGWRAFQTPVTAMSNVIYYGVFAAQSGFYYWVTGRERDCDPSG